MPMSTHETRFRQAFLLLLLTVISLAFMAVIRAFLVTILLAAIFTALSYPVYEWLLRRGRGRANLAAVGALLLLLLLVLVPLAAVLTAAANEALHMTNTLGPSIQRLVNEPGGLDARLRALPFYTMVAPYRDEVLTKLGEVLGSLSSYLFAVLSATTVATASLVFYFVVLLYTMFYFFTDGPAMLAAVMSHLPLDDADKQRMLDRFVSITRATLRGTVFIGAAQGTLGGLAFWVAGVDGAIFWGTVMTVLSIIPGVGGALVWVPTAIILAATGEWWTAAGLAAFCGLIIGSVDNLLRPRLVGRDAQLHELLIFFSTLGGLMVLGPMGFILGPILAGLFVTAWEMFGISFRKELHSTIVTLDDPSA